jgi:hypothetical protein
VEIDALLLRQIHPDFVQNGRPTSQVFKPTPKDEDLLSVDNGSMIAPQTAWEKFTSKPGNRSIGVLGVTYGECTQQQLAVIEDGAPEPEHCSIDFSGLTRGAIDKKAKLLTHFAIKRDWLFRAASDRSGPGEQAKGC